ncbi:MAG: hypothetical protein IKG56_02750 [Clostridia bacterium]|nr:hypothetical protein [Clostridia bacterium]
MKYLDKGKKLSKIINEYLFELRVKRMFRKKIEKKPNLRRRLVLAICGIAAGLALGLGIKNIADGIEQRSLPPMEQMEKTPEEVQNLGFSSQEQFEEFKSISENLERQDLTESEVEELKERLIRFQLEVVKERLSEADYERRKELFDTNFLPGSESLTPISNDEIVLRQLNLDHGEYVYVIAFKNPSSTHIDANGIGDKDVVFTSANGEIDSRICSFIDQIVMLQSSHPSQEELQKALSKTEAFIIGRITLEDGRQLVFSDDPEIIQAIADMKNREEEGEIDSQLSPEEAVDYSDAIDQAMQEIQDDMTRGEGDEPSHPVHDNVDDGDR